MSNQRKLILHLGCHKTGTSAIQGALYKSRALLSDQGFTLFCKNPDGTERVSGDALTWVRFRFCPHRRVHGLVRPGFAEALAASEGNVIASAETLSWIFDPKEIHQLAENLYQHFDSVRLVSYVRRQDEQAVSHYQQAAKHSGFIASRYFGTGNRALPEYGEHLQHYLNYSCRLGYWADAFGQSNVSIRVFDPRKLVGADAVADFFELTGLPWNGKSERKNESRGLVFTKTARLLSQGRLDYTSWKDLMQHIPDSQPMLPSRKSAREFYEHFREGNLLLNEKFKISKDTTLFTEDFSKYPESDMDCWDEDSANAALEALIKGFLSANPVSSPDIEVIRRAANAIQPLDPSLSYDLINVANSLGGIRPDLKIEAGFRSRVRSFLRKRPLFPWGR
ncbi:hypothetical protein BST95_01235 [Halioglobus japonicus]|uniref:Sulfotransferase family protein n=1 Tax=Halioglobus japonicus TaxID=930805 RepID=A0AAP8SLW9_9GAMM|nr:hypothetical protein BST95_01235 [Halioglobus japonicus]PLW84947.1 hypothetical protein C0029_15500 [Halioglobus japonicus]